MKPNKEQAAIIAAPEAQILVLAAAGSGKTRVIIWRILALIEQGYDAAKIVAITFTNIAAGELEARLAVHKVKIGYVGTLHGYALRQIANHGAVLGYVGMPTIITEEEATERRKAVIKRLRLTASTSLEAIDNAIGTKGTSNAHLVAIAYRKELRASNAVDFTTILAEFETLLVMNPFLSLDGLFVDEYQDSGARDARIYGLIHAELDFRVGDVDQSIFGFRGGRVENILELASVRATYHLPTNYRSARSIVAAANRLLEDALGTREPMQAFRKETGIVTLKEYPNVLTEAASIAALIRHSGRPESDFAVLTRFNARSFALRAALASEGVTVRAITRPKLEASTMAAMEQLSRNTVPPGDIGAALVSLGVSMAEIRAVNDAWTIDLETTLLSLKGEEESISGDGVHVGTIHSLKGGQAPVVFMAGMEAHTTPGKKKGDDLAEERRIAYVGMTRAMDELHISWSRQAPDSAGFGMIEAAPSPFTLCI